MNAWRNLRDPYRKKVLNPPQPKPAKKTTGGGKKKSGSKGETKEKQAKIWRFQERMSFLKPYIYVKQ